MKDGPPHSLSALYVLSGHHQGARIYPVSASTTVGGREGLDVFLSDESCRGGEMSIAREADGSVKIVCAAGNVSVGRRNMKPEESLRLKPGVPLRISDVELALGDTFEHAVSALDNRDRLMGRVRWVGSIAAIVVVLGIVGQWSSDFSAGGKVIGAQLADSGSATVQGDPLGELRATLTNAGLSSVKVERIGQSDTLKATGNIIGDQFAAWNDVRRWFDGRFGASAVLVSEIGQQNAGLALPFDVRSVAGQPTPRVVLHDGRSYGIGDALPGGWRLEGVSGGKVDLVGKDGETLRLRF